MKYLSFFLVKLEKKCINIWLTLWTKWKLSLVNDAVGEPSISINASRKEIKVSLENKSEENEI